MKTFVDKLMAIYDIITCNDFALFTCKDPQDGETLSCVITKNLDNNVCDKNEKRFDAFIYACIEMLNKRIAKD